MPINEKGEYVNADPEAIYDVLKGAGTFAYSTADSALFGIPTAIVKAANSDAYQKLKQLREENKEAALMGDIAGVFVPTSGLLAKGVGAGVKGLGAGAKALKLGKTANVLSKVGGAADKASDIIKYGKFADDASDAVKLGGTIRGAAARGALTAAEQVPARLLSGEMTGQDAAKSIALGGGIGAGLSAAGKIIPARSVGLSKNKLRELAEDTALSGTNMKSDYFKKALAESAKAQGLTGSSKTGSIIKNAENLKGSTLKLMKKFSLETSDDIVEFLAGEGAKWDKATKAVEEAGIGFNDILDNIIADPEIQAIAQTYGVDAAEALDDVVNTASKSRNLMNAKQILNKNIQLANKSTDIKGSLRGDISRIMREKIDDQISEFVPELKEMKETWKAVQPLRQMAAVDKASLDPIKVGGGSDTAAKQTILKTLMPTAQAASTLSGITTFDKDDPSTWAPSALLVGGGLIGGNIANRIPAAVANKLLGKTAEGILNIADSPAGAKIAGMAGKLEKPTTAIEKFFGGRTSKKPLDQPMAEEQVVDKEAPTVKEEAKQALNEKYVTKLGQTLQRDYQLMFADQMSYEDFIAQVDALTDGFEPTKTAAILFKDPKDREQYLRDYNVLLKIKGADIDQKGPNVIESFIDPSSAAEKRKSFSDLISIIGTLVVSEGKTLSKADNDRIKADLKAISDLPASPEEKKQLLLKKLSETYGFNLSTLQDMGLA